MRPTKSRPNINDSWTRELLSIHADPLPGYTWTGSRYRSNVTGRFVARRDILGLLDAQVVASEQRSAALTNAVMEGRIALAVWQEQMRSEVRRQILSQTALGSGGWDRISQAGYGRAGRDLRDLYGKIAGTARDIADGRITTAQALARVNEYAGHGRSHFYQAAREVAQPTAPNTVILERRMLGGGGKTCGDCIHFYDQGWQPMGVLPPPGADSVCGGNCKCSLLTKEVEAGEANEWIGSKR